MSKGGFSTRRKREQFATVARFLWLDDADQAASVLRGYGIDCSIPDRRFLSLYPRLAVALGGVKLRVAGVHLPDAVEVLRQTVWKKVVRCPNCDSPSVARGKRTGWLVFAIFAFGGIPVRPLPRRWRCCDCGFKWKARHDVPD